MTDPISYQVEAVLYAQNGKKLLRHVKKHGVIEDEHYLWGFDHFGRQTRKRIILRFQVPKEKLRVIKIIVSQLNQPPYNNYVLTPVTDPNNV